MVTDLGARAGPRARLSKQGRITVPKAVRDALGLRPGDDLEFVPQGETYVVERRRRRSILDFAGLAADAVSRTPATAEELDEMIEAGMTADAVARDAKIARRAVFLSEVRAAEAEHRAGESAAFDDLEQLLDDLRS